MVANHFRWDFIGLSTDDKPTPATSSKVADGSTFYCSDNSKLYIWYKDQWYEKTATGGGGGTTYTAGDGIDITNDTISIDDTYVFTGTDGTANGAVGLVPAPTTSDEGKFLKADGTWDTAGGGGVTPVQSIGNSTTSVMSQDAVAKAIYDSVDATRGYRPKIGYQATTGGLQSVAFGDDAKATGSNAVAVGGNTLALQNGAIAIGYGASTGSVGEMNIGTSNTSYGYSSSNYRLLSGVHDPVNAHDAATKGYVDAHSGGGSSAFHLITASDYNWDSSGSGGAFDTVAAWLLPTGWYILDENSPDVLINTDDYMGFEQGCIFYVLTDSNTTDTIIGGIALDWYGDSGVYTFVINKSDGSSVDTGSLKIDDVSTALAAAEEANEKHQINYPIPTTTTSGILGGLYSCGQNQKLYMCTAIDDSDPDNPVYTWTAIN